MSCTVNLNIVKKPARICKAIEYAIWTRPAWDIQTETSRWERGLCPAVGRIHTGWMMTMVMNLLNKFATLYKRLIDSLTKLFRIFVYKYKTNNNSIYKFSLNQLLLLISRTTFLLT